MRYYTLHLVARWQATIGISTLTSVNQTLNASLNGQLSSFLRIGLLLISRRSTRAIVEVESKFIHFMRMTSLLEASHTKVKVIAYGAVVPARKTLTFNFGYHIKIAQFCCIYGLTKGPTEKM